MSDDVDLKDIERRMAGAVDTLKTEFAGLRTGRASTQLLEPVTVEVYGTKMPITQVATVNAPEPRLLTVQVWDQNNVESVEKAIRNAALGLNPQTEGALIRIPVPELNEERRTELSKVAARYTEQARIAVRNVRRDGMDQVKKADGLGEDEQKRLENEIQRMTDSAIERIDQMLSQKEKEIMQV